MKNRSKVPELAELRGRYGVFIPFRVPSDGFREIRTACKRKVYRRGAPKGRWVYHGAVLQPHDKRRSPHEIAARIDKRSLEELNHLVHDPIQEILARAHCGDKKAIAQFARVALDATASLERLAHFEPNKVRTVAEKSTRWPVLLSLNRYDINWAKAHLKSCGVGSKTPNPPNPRQNFDPRNFWTRLAGQALMACKKNREVVPLLQAHIKGARKQRKIREYWRTPANAMLYYLDGGGEIHISDWQRQCAKLSKQPTPRNFNDWWRCAKACVLEHWHSDTGKDDYPKAIKLIQNADTRPDTAGTRFRTGQYAESRQRAHALEKIRRALASLVGVRVPQQRPPTS